MLDGGGEMKLNKATVAEIEYILAQGKTVQISARRDKISVWAVSNKLKIEQSISQDGCVREDAKTQASEKTK
jgi:hypothetical protein